MKSGSAELLGSLGCAVIVVFGAVVSIVQVKLAGVGVGVACGVGRADLEGVRAVGRGRCSSSGVAQEDQLPPSSWHSKVEPPSLELKEKSASAELLGSLGCAVIVVFGAAVSIVHVNDAGVGSVLPAASVARTSKVCEPWLRPV